MYVWMDVAVVVLVVSRQAGSGPSRYWSETVILDSYIPRLSLRRPVSYLPSCHLMTGVINLQLLAVLMDRCPGCRSVEYQMHLTIVCTSLKPQIVGH